jgi:hypothetical protein
MSIFHLDFLLANLIQIGQVQSQVIVRQPFVSVVAFGTKSTVFFKIYSDYHGICID